MPLARKQNLLRVLKFDCMCNSNSNSHVVLYGVSVSVLTRGRLAPKGELPVAGGQAIFCLNLGRGHYGVTLDIFCCIGEETLALTNIPKLPSGQYTHEYQLQFVLNVVL